MQSVIQEEATGCAIAAVANIVGKTYSEMKAIANSMGIFATDQALWSEVNYVREMLAAEGIAVSEQEHRFLTWESLPDLALLSIKHHQQAGKNFWHWVVFKRENGNSAVLDSASYLPNNLRTDFSAMEPKWYIAVNL